MYTYVNPLFSLQTRRVSLIHKVTNFYKGELTGVSPDACIGEEENHGDESAYDHRSAASPKPPRLAHIACEDRRRDRAQITRQVVLPAFGIGEAANSSASGREVPSTV